MRRTFLAGVAAAVLVGGLSTGVVLAAADPDDGDNGRPGQSSGQSADARDGRRLGPPAWAQAHGHDKGDDARGHGRANGHDKAWLDAWRDLTPQQREQRMRDIARAHAEGMRDWEQCVADATRAQRAECEKPPPPGQAKRQL